MEYDQIAIIAVFVAFYSAAAGGIERTAVSGAVVFTFFGFTLGPDVLRFLSLDVNADALRLIAELTLALLLFVDASKTDFKILSGSFKIPERLILISLPMVLIAGFAVGVVLFPDMPLLEVAILAAVLAPTDAALGKAVVSNRDVRPEIRGGLNFESGLNDGVCVPFFLAFLALAVGTGGEETFTGLVTELVIHEIGIGAAVGLVFSWLAARLLKFANSMNWISESWIQIPVAATAIGCFCAAQALHGSGFIAAFVGGLLFGWLAGPRTHKLVEASEGIGDTLALLTWVIFGAAIVGPLWEVVTWESIIYAVCSLTVIRMLPVFLVLFGVGLSTPEKLFIGWFGPRGLASIVFTVMVVNSGLEGGSDIAVVATCTILLSVIAHGLSAKPLIALLKRDGERRSAAP